MFSFYPSHPRAIRYLPPPVYSVYPDDDLHSPYLSWSPDSSRSRVLVTNPEMRYRRALGEYVAAKEEYNAVLRAREGANAKLRARAEAIHRQERARLRTAQVVRARREQQARQF